MRKNEVNYALLVSVFVAALVTSNVLASKVFHVGPLEVPAAVIAYPITFLVTDVIGEIWGKPHAQKTIYIGIMCQIMSLILITCAIYLPPAGYMEEYDESFRSVLGSTARVVFASLASFMASQTCDVYLFHKLRDLYFKQKWIRNNASTMCAQVVDSIVFVTLAYAGSGYDIVLMIGSQIVIKWIMALCDTPFFYVLSSEKSDSSR